MSNATEGSDDGYVTADETLSEMARKLDKLEREVLSKRYNQEPVVVEISKDGKVRTWRDV